MNDQVTHERYGNSNPQSPTSATGEHRIRSSSMPTYDAWLRLRSGMHADGPEYESSSYAACLLETTRARPVFHETVGKVGQNRHIPRAPTLLSSARTSA